MKIKRQSETKRQRDKETERQRDRERQRGSETVRVREKEERDIEIQGGKQYKDRKIVYKWKFFQEHQKDLILIVNFSLFFLFFFKEIRRDRNRDI